MKIVIIICARCCDVTPFCEVVQLHVFVYQLANPSYIDTIPKICTLQLPTNIRFGYPHTYNRKASLVEYLILCRYKAHVQ